MKRVLSNKINTINKYLSFERSLEISRKEIFAIYSIFMKLQTREVKVT